MSPTPHNGVEPRALCLVDKCLPLRSILTLGQTLGVIRHDERRIFIINIILKTGVCVLCGVSMCEGICEGACTYVVVGDTCNSVCVGVCCTWYMCGVCIVYM